MLLKKQTVWLLTMLSLVVVLSVYYITSPEQQKSGDLAAVEKNTDNKKTETSSSDGTTIISGMASDEMFQVLRLKLEEQRTKMKEDLQAIVASTNLPAEERSNAIEKMNQLDEIAQKEGILETLIISMGYEDALVRADGENVRITVKAKEHSAAAANEIIQMVRTELGALQPVAVQFELVK